MGETWGIIRELLQVILLLATVPAQLAWPMLASGSGPRVLVGASMLIAVYGGCSRRSRGGRCGCSCNGELRRHAASGPDHSSAQYHGARHIPYDEARHHMF